MPRVSRERAKANRAAVVQAASELLRERGAAGVTVEAVSSRAGLTHGGFYKQFETKDALLSEAIALASQQRRDAVAATISEHGSAARAVLANWYLSPEHRDNPGSGCAVAALVGDVTIHHGGPLRSGYLNALDDLISAVSASSGTDGIAAVALMVGALELARATAGTALSDKFLRTAREQLRVHGEL